MDLEEEAHILVLHDKRRKDSSTSPSAISISESTVITSYQQSHTQNTHSPDGTVTMPHKDRDTSAGESREALAEDKDATKSSERKHRSKPDRERDPNKPHKSKSSRVKIIDPDTGEVKHRRRKEKDRTVSSSSAMDGGMGRPGESTSTLASGTVKSASMADLVPEIARTSSAPGSNSRMNLPYPSFNKAFSKEAVASRDDVRLGERHKDPFTPESTDVSGAQGDGRRKSADFAKMRGDVGTNYRPPSPPETEFSQQMKSSGGSGSGSRMAKVQEEDGDMSRSSSRGSARSKDDGSRISSKSKQSRTSTTIPTKSRKATVESVVDSDLKESMRRESMRIDSMRNSHLSDSTVTSLAPKREDEVRNEDAESSPASAQDSSPRTPTQTPTFPPMDVKSAPSYMHFEQPSENISSAFDSPQPPPPPPPPLAPLEVPQVDYLMQHGGLLRPAPKTLISAIPQFTPNLNNSRTSTPMPSEIEKIFGPYYNVLDQYETVINKNGSVAVATGYRSVARRLLDRLENVFNRDLSSEGCQCVMCLNPDLRYHEGSRGLGWGEVLEWVSARREVPVWPAFDFATLGVKAGEELAGLGISGHARSGSDGMRPSSPIKIDPDIAEEFREHYLAQSAKKKVAVNKWLSSCPQTAAAPPQEVDDETLSFAILTHLEQADRPIFNALVNGSTVLQPASRMPTTIRKPRSEFMIKTVHSIQRLYRLSEPPRDPEAAIYLLKNPQIHNLLATMSSINASEYEILTSGRFDGFLWSGAEDYSSPAVSRNPTPVSAGIRSPMSPALRQANNSRTTTPFSPLRNQTFSPSIGIVRGQTPLRHPVSNDEETEIAVLAEVEREIYLGMEALEDAFEGLHRKAEFVRRALRERGAGLSMSLQSRRTSAPEVIRSTTPGTGVGWGYEREREKWDGTEESEASWDGIDDGRSEIAPDDSASNISSHRHRRPKRRNERRTPALVEEEDED